MQLRTWVFEHEAKDPILRLDNDKSRLQLGIYLVANPPRVSLGNDKKSPTYTTVTTPEGQSVTTSDANRPDDLDWKPIMQWDLHPVDLAQARDDKFGLFTAVFQQYHDPSKKSDPAVDERQSDSLEIRSLDADLSLLNSGPLPISISSESINGTVTLSDKALMNLTVHGGIPAVHPPAARPGTNPGALDIGLNALKVDSIDITMVDAAPSTGAHQLTTGTVKIESVTGARLSFDKEGWPSEFRATITKAHAENIRWSKAAKK